MSSWVIDMLKISVLCIGRLKERYFEGASAEYIKRLSGYCKIEVTELEEGFLPANPTPAQVDQALYKEGDMLISKVIKDAYTIAACIEGTEMSSTELSAFLLSLTEKGISRLCFFIGGSHGLHANIKAHARYMFSMSKMTFPHQLARIMLLEQLYRAFKIAEGGKYHK